MKSKLKGLLLIGLMGWVAAASAQKKTGFQTLDFLYSISGSKTIAGIHNREPNATPARWTNKVDSVTGKFPGLWSGDFLFQQDNINNRQLMVDEALRQWKKGAVINIMWHACDPAMLEPCGWNKEGVLSKMTDAKWTELTTDGTPLNKEWKKRVDEVAVYLKFLKDNGVEVLWRPMHEMNQKVFWWGGRPGPDGTAKLYRMLHDYMVKEKGLTNLIWVWDIQDFNSLADDAKAYNPGDKYWDVAALDVYDDKTGYSAEKYNIMLSVCNGKPIAIGECQKFPSVDQLKAQPKWTFFMCWSELEFSKNTVEQIQAIHTASNVLTLDEMPGWKK
ncbi:glycoside hydrolase family 26 protein [Mucilaginibacter jinjuensis]|uniref:Glycosyl hydrolase n=1 Tax=Mucilaginibacter jinjuensis TaxID=1176721 RepID=A0ABY7TEQ7_9SPHI|nr:glycosyl hydrolase [Mucilaginibacter jinjuensis]WCT14853.1 glycosyl hydrolase [Mucilaginibacter jinjuensis]